VFWEQQGLQTFRPTVQITRSQPASQPAFDRHFTSITEEYYASHAINLLGTKENEAALTDAYSRHLRQLQGLGVLDVGITHYDFHNQVKLGGHDSVVEIRYVQFPRRIRPNSIYFIGACTVSGSVLINLASLQSILAETSLSLNSKAYSEQIAWTGMET
jgi:hypothetical protein